MRRLFLLALCASISVTAHAQEDAPAAHLSRFGPGDGPSQVEGVIHLLDAARTPLQSNAVAFDRADEGAFERVVLTGRMHVGKGGDGGAFVFLNTDEYGVRGPAPYVKSWVEPNLRKTFAVGIDVHNPPNEEMFGPWGNYQGLPQREVSLHWDGREIVKRVAPAEFRGEFVDVEVVIHHVVGGARITVQLGEALVYAEHFLAGVTPYESRLAVGAATRADATTTFDLEGLRYESSQPAAPRRPPLHVEVFNHVLTDNSKTAFAKEVDLPPSTWAFGRVIMTVEIHDAGADWDEWDRCGEVSIWDDEGTKLGIVPFITSYRTPCHWQVDVTHFRPYLTGRRKIEVAAGTNFYENRGYMMSITLDFHHGTPDLEAYRVVPLWVGTAKYKSAENHFSDFFTPRTVAIEEGVESARVFVTTTGHSQVGEFTPSERTVVFASVKGEKPEARFANVLWKNDCYLNPNRPQFGTWKFSRAGWAPGDVVRPWWIDLTPQLKIGREAELRYEPKPYDFGDAEPKPTAEQVNQASHNVRAYLILYRAADALVPAPTILVSGVQKGSNAANAGMKAGDYLESYDGKRVDSVDDLRAAMQGAKAAEKETVVVVVFRGAERLELELDVGPMGVNLGSR